jgi:hypothetical protein
VQRGWAGCAGSEEKIYMGFDFSNSNEFGFWQDFDNFLKEI